MTHPYAIATRLLVAMVLTAALTLAVSVVLAPRSTRRPDLKVDLSGHEPPPRAVWGGRAEDQWSSPNGTPAVEVGDRQGDLHAFDLANPVLPGDPSTPAPGWPTSTGATVGGGTGCNSPTQGVGTVLTGYNGVEVPGSPPIDSTASIDPGSGNLLVDAGNAAEAADGGSYAYSPSGGEI